MHIDLMIYMAAINNDVAELESLKKQGGNVNTTSFSGDPSLMHNAAYVNAVDAMK